MTIPASAIVQINPGVIGAGGNPLALNSIILTQSTAVPIGQVMPFSIAADVSAYFGPSSLEYALAQIYFQGFDNKTQTPGRLYFAQYPESAVHAYVRGGSLAAMTIAQLDALSGTLILTIDGTVHTSASISLSGVASFSAGATTIAAGFTGLGGTVSYDAIHHAYVFTSSTTGVASTITACTGTLATALKMTVATGAVLSQGADAATPGAFMDGVVDITRNWAAFGTTWEPVLSEKEAFAAWIQTQNDKYMYVVWDSDANAIVANNTTAFGPVMLANQSDGIFAITGDASCVSQQGDTLANRLPLKMAFVLGCVGSIDFTRFNSRIDFAFKHQAGLPADVGNQTAMDNLIANGYNAYGAYATANQDFVFMFPGAVTGKYLFADDYVNEIWLNNAFQLAFMNLLNTVPSIPDNPQGDSLIEGAALDPINAAVNFGAIRPNVTLSALQKAEVNNAAGVEIDTILSTRGWYLQVLRMTPQQRALRGPKNVNFWYMGGGGVHKISMASVLVL